MKECIHGYKNANATDELKRIRNAVHDKQIFPIVEESTLSGLQYWHILVGSLETPHVSYLYDCQPLKYTPKSNKLLQQLTMLLKILESTETSSACYFLMPQNI